MTNAELPEKLRALADRIEAARLPGAGRADVSITIHGITDRDELRRAVQLIRGKPNVEVGCHGENYVSMTEWTSPERVGWHIWFAAGLLGGEVVTSIKDGTAGLGELLAESAGAA